MINLLFLGKKSDLDFKIHDYQKRLPGKVSINYQKKLNPFSKIVIGCDERGKTLNSFEFSSFLEKYHFNLDIVVGFDDGLPEFNYEEKICLAPFVMAHDIARLVLVEQIYRGYTIYENHPYHK